MLETIVSRDPINFVFEISEAHLIPYTRAAANGARPLSREAGKPVQVRLADETQWRRAGEIDFIDIQLHASPATIRGRAVFDNNDQLLTPGTFGRIRLAGT